MSDPSLSQLSMAEAWRRYNELCVPKDATPSQRDDIRNAFYIAADTALTHMGWVGSNVSERAAWQYLELTRRECQTTIASFSPKILGSDPS